MPKYTKHSIVILTGQAHPALARAVAQKVHAHFECVATSFADTESRIDITKSIRNKEIYIIQPTGPSNNRSSSDNLFELGLIIDAARRASALHITAIIPYFGYCRQERKDRPRTSISAKRAAEYIESCGANRIITLDIHQEAIMGFVEIPWENLPLDTLLPKKLLKKIEPKKLVVIAPDMGSTKRAQHYMNLLRATSFATIYKKRNPYNPNQSEAVSLAGEVTGMDCIIIDDMIDTAGTIVSAAQFLKKQGAGTILVAATHGLFSNNNAKKINALSRLMDSSIDRVIVTDTLAPRSDVLQCKKISIISVASLIATAILRTHRGQSLSKGLIL